LKRLLLLSACFFALICGGNASDIYNNLNSSTAGSDPVSYYSSTYWGPLADSFSTGAGGFAVNQVTVLLSGDNTSLGSISAYLLSDNAVHPGGVLATFGTLNDSSLARFIHDLEDTKGLFCYKHVAET